MKVKRLKNLWRTASRRRISLAPPPAGFMTARRPELPHASRKGDGGATEGLLSVFLNTCVLLESGWQCSIDHVRPLGYMRLSYTMYQSASGLPISTAVRLTNTKKHHVRANIVPSCLASFPAWSTKTLLCGLLSGWSSSRTLSLLVIIMIIIIIIIIVKMNLAKNWSNDKYETIKISQLKTRHWTVFGRKILPTECIQSGNHSRMAITITLSMNHCRSNTN